MQPENCIFVIVWLPISLNEVRQKVNRWLDRTNSPHELIVRNLLSDVQLEARLDRLISEGYEKLAQKLINYLDRDYVADNLQSLKS